MRCVSAASAWTCRSALGIAVTFIASTGATFDPGGIFGHEVYFDSMTMFVSFLLAARYLELHARHRAMQSLESALDRMPQQAQRLLEGGGSETVSTMRLAPGDRVRVALGQPFPADGVLHDGRTRVDESLLTGESTPVAKGPGDALVGGSVNLGSPATMTVQRVGADTRHEAIVALMRDAMTQRPALARVADALGRTVPVDRARAVGGCRGRVERDRSITRGVGGGGGADRHLPLRAVAVGAGGAGGRCRRPGATWCAGAAPRCAGEHGAARPSVHRQDRHADDPGPAVAAGPGAEDPCADGPARRRAGHRRVAGGLVQPPLVGRVGCRRAEAEAAPWEWREVEEQAGRGLVGRDPRGLAWRLGSAEFAGASGLAADGDPRAAVWLAADDGALACFVFDEALREGAAEAMAALRADGYRLSLLSGDSPARAQQMAQQLQLQSAIGGATPQDKLDAVAAAQARGERVAMVGDGVNDAPVLARADVSLAMGQGALVARAQADAVLVGNRPMDIVHTLAVARKAMRIVRQNLGWALAYNAACVPLALAGLLPPWAAGLGMALSSLVVVVNALRVAR